MLYQEPPRGFSVRAVKHGPYSPSRLIVARCPQRFFGQYIRKDRSTGASLASARGSAIHHVLSLITKALIAGEKISPTQLSNWVSESVALWPASYAQVDLIKDAAAAYIGNPSPYLNKDTNCEMAFGVAFYEEDTLLDDVAPRTAYVPVPYVEENGLPNPAAFFAGRLDQINVDHITKTVVILDHKSTPNAAQNEDVNFQLGAYAWLVSMFYPGYQIKTVIHFCHPGLNFYQAPVYWSDIELKNIESYIHACVGAIEHFEEFPAIPGSACDYCHMVQECPENLKLCEQKARGEVDLNVRNFEDLKRLASNLRTIGALYDELNKVLKDGIETLSPTRRVDIDGMWYGWKVSEETIDWIATDMKIREESQRAKRLLLDPVEDGALKAKYELMAKIPDLNAFMKHYNIDPDVFKKWEAAKLKNILKTDNQPLINNLKDFIVKDRSTRYGNYKN
jgi:hypothetical protein